MGNNTFYQKTLNKSFVTSMGISNINETSPTDSNAEPIINFEALLTGGANYHILYSIANKKDAINSATYNITSDDIGAVFDYDGSTKGVSSSGEQKSVFTLLNNLHSNNGTTNTDSYTRQMIIPNHLQNGSLIYDNTISSYYFIPSSTTTQTSAVGLVVDSSGWSNSNYSMFSIGGRYNFSSSNNYIVSYRPASSGTDGVNSVLLEQWKIYNYNANGMYLNSSIVSPSKNIFANNYYDIINGFNNYVGSSNGPEQKVTSTANAANGAWSYISATSGAGQIMHMFLNTKNVIAGTLNTFLYDDIGAISYITSDANSFNTYPNLDIMYLYPGISTTSYNIANTQFTTSTQRNNSITPAQYKIVYIIPHLMNMITFAIPGYSGGWLPSNIFADRATLLNSSIKAIPTHYGSGYKHIVVVTSGAAPTGMLYTYDTTGKLVNQIQFS